MNLVKVIAYVELESLAAKEAAAQRFRESEWANKPAELERIVANILDSTKYQMEVTLTAELGDGRQIRSGKRFRFFGPRDGPAAIWHRYRGPDLAEDPDVHQRLLRENYHVGLSDVQDAVNQMLGRDPEQHRPPRTSWRPLQDALAADGITVSEQELIETPLELVLDEAARAEVGERIS